MYRRLPSLGGGWGSPRSFSTSARVDRNGTNPRQSFAETATKLDRKRMMRNRGFMVLFRINVFTASFKPVSVSVWLLIRGGFGLARQMIARHSESTGFSLSGQKTRRMPNEFR